MLWFLVLFLVVGLGAGQIIELVPGWTFDCSNMTFTPVENNPVALQYLYDICSESSVCSKLYGINNGATLHLFSTFLFQQSPHTLPLYIESPFLDIMCGKTYEEALRQEWKRSMIISGEDFNTCGQGEEFLPVQRKCRPELGNTPNSCTDQNSINIVLLSVFIVIACVGLGYGLYKTFGERRT